MDERARWGRRVAALLRDGIGLVDALEIARDETDSFELAGPLGWIVDRVRRGEPLAAALADLPELFGADVVADVRGAATREDLANVLEVLGAWEPPAG